MARYTGTIDDYLRATSRAVELADRERVLVLYDPNSEQLTGFKIDVGERGAKQVDKIMEKANAAIIAAQDEVRQVIEQIKTDGGGSAISDRALKKLRDKARHETPSRTSPVDDSTGDSGPGAPAESAPAH